MKITRKLESGLEITVELTSDEIRDAYYEYEHECDKNDVINEIESEDFESDYECSADTAMKYIEEIAVEKRRNIDKYDMQWHVALHEAILSVIADNED